MTIALPLQRIGALMDCDWTQVRRWRIRAVREGWLWPVERYVAHRRAGHYSYLECPTRADATEERTTGSDAVPLGTTVPLTSTTSGLVGHPKNVRLTRPVTLRAGCEHEGAKLRQSKLKAVC